MEAGDSGRGAGAGRGLAWHSPVTWWLFTWNSWEPTLWIPDPRGGSALHLEGSQQAYFWIFIPLTLPIPLAEPYWSTVHRALPLSSKNPKHTAFNECPGIWTHKTEVCQDVYLICKSFTMGFLYVASSQMHGNITVHKIFRGRQKEKCFNWIDLDILYMLKVTRNVSNFLLAFYICQRI